MTPDHPFIAVYTLLLIQSKTSSRTADTDDPSKHQELLPNNAVLHPCRPEDYLPLPPTIIWFK